MAKFALIAATLLLLPVYHICLAVITRIQAARRGYKQPPRYKHIDPFFGLDLFLATGKSVKNNRFNEEHAARFEKYGPTFQANLWGKSCFYSVDPQNLEAVLTGTTWGVQPIRLAIMGPMCGAGFMTTDGEEARQKRNMLRPSLHESNISDFTPLETNLRLMLEKLPRDGRKFDLQAMVFKLYLDMNTLFLFGESIGCLSDSPPEHAEGFLDSLNAATRGCGFRMALGPLQFILPRKSWLDACQKTQAFADRYVDRALEYRRTQLPEKKLHTDEPSKGIQRTMLYKLAELTEDRALLRYQILQTLVAGWDTIPTLISNTIFLLTRHEEAHGKVKAEIAELGNKELTFDTLSRMAYLQSVLRESLRLYPILPHIARAALTDTFLPRGGGSDGQAPVFVPAGSMFRTSWSTLHRRKDIWGEDAADFRPERWLEDGFKPGPFEYMPFGGGKRGCIAKQKALMDVSYVIVRLLQDHEIVAGDDLPYVSHYQLTAGNANGCWISLVDKKTSKPHFRLVELRGQMVAATEAPLPAGMLGDVIMYGETVSLVTL